MHCFRDIQRPRRRNNNIKPNNKGVESVSNHQEAVKDINSSQPSQPPPPIIPFQQHFPTDVFRIILDFYIDECARQSNLRALSYLMRTCRLLHRWIGPNVYRFINLTNFDHLISFIESTTTSYGCGSTTLRYTKSISVASDLCPTQASVFVRSLITLLDGRLERLCLGPGFSIPPSKCGALFVRDVTLIYQSHYWMTKPGNMLCQRLRLTPSQELLRLFNGYPLWNSHWSWIHRQVQLTHLAIEVPNPISVADVYHTLNVYTLPRPTAADGPQFQQIVAVLYFETKWGLADFRSRILTAQKDHNKPKGLKIACLLSSDYERLTFGSLEVARQDYWERISLYFLPLLEDTE